VVVLGLGNPGDAYAQTRHNAGFIVAEAARRRWGDQPWRRAGQAEESRIRLRGRHHRLIRPLTFMNLSGEVVAALARQGVAAVDLLVLLDDIDLPFGRLRIRRAGGAGGHRGLQSILDVLGTEAVARMRIGVGRPGGPQEVVDHVLGPFRAEEEERLGQLVARCLEALAAILARGIGPAMTRFNGLAAPWEDPPAGSPPPAPTKRPAAAPGEAEAETAEEGD
jgi:PTH1 family peptidyl-tRNA hydrolase